MTTVFIVSGTTQTIPADFGSLTSVEVLAAGSSGNSTNTVANRAAGGGTAYAKILSTSTALTPGASINIGVGAGGTAVTGTTTSIAGGNTWWNATSLADAVTNGSAVSCAAQGGQAAASAVAGLGGTAANSVGTTKFSGGNGFVATATPNMGGGGAAGPSGAGTNGSVTAGGAANNNTTAGPTVAANGNSGTEFDASHGCGTGAFTTGAAFTGGLYGGGGTGTSAAVASGPGANGLIVFIYAPGKAQPPFSRPIRFYTRRF